MYSDIKCIFFRDAVFSYYFFLLLQGEPDSVAALSPRELSQTNFLLEQLCKIRRSRGMHYGCWLSNLMSDQNWRFMSGKNYRIMALRVLEVLRCALETDLSGKTGYPCQSTGSTVSLQRSIRFPACQHSTKSAETDKQALLVRHDESYNQVIPVRICLFKA